MLVKSVEELDFNSFLFKSIIFNKASPPDINIFLLLVSKIPFQFLLSNIFFGKKFFILLFKLREVFC